MSCVQFDAVSVALGGRTVLSGIDFALEDGAFIGVLGPNGAGKTTLMRTILGLVRPIAGSVSVLGAPAARGNAAIGYMPQLRTPTGFGLTGRDFVASAAGGGRWGLPMLNRADASDIDRALGLVDAAGLAARPIGALSGGERQRLLLAQALLGRPRLLLLDEPLMSLDPRHQQAVVDLVRGVQRELGITVLFSAHDMNPLLGAMDAVLYLGGGRAATGSVDQVITGPVLSALFGTPIEVAQAGGRRFVLAGGALLDAAHA